MKIIDVSHWQGAINWKKLKIDAVIMKATEGISFVDPEFKNNQRQARKRGLLLGYYHFARGGNYKQEALHFVNTIDHREGEIIVLDWEIQHTDTVDWCLGFLKEVEKLTGAKPLIYLNVATLKANNWDKVVENNNGLWIAKYGWNLGRPGKVPGSYAWPFWVMWQYTSRGIIKGVKGFVDLSYSGMTPAQFRAYGTSIGGVVECEKAMHKVKKYKKKLKKWEKILKNKCK